MAGRGILRAVASPPFAATDPDEGRLLDRARGGDREAFEQLVEAHLPRVWRVVWRIVREALWDSYERKRLYHEATSFLKLRAERWKWVRQGGDAEKPMISVPASPASGND